MTSLIAWRTDHLNEPSWQHFRLPKAWASKVNSAKWEHPEYRHIHCHAYGHFFGPYGHELTDLQIPAAEGLVLETFPVDPRTRSRRVPACRGGRSQRAAAVDVREQCHGGEVVAIGELVTLWPPRHDG